MPKYYCDYCDKYLTHDSLKSRKQHNAGKVHKANVREYYQRFAEQETQSLIDQRIKEHLEQTATYQQFSGVYNHHYASFPANPQLLLLPVMPTPAGGQVRTFPSVLMQSNGKLNPPYASVSETALGVYNHHHASFPANPQQPLLSMMPTPVGGQVHTFPSVTLQPYGQLNPPYTNVSATVPVVATTSSNAIPSNSSNSSRNAAPSAKTPAGDCTYVEACQGNNQAVKNGRSLEPWKRNVSKKARTSYGS